MPAESKEVSISNDKDSMVESYTYYNKAGHKDSFKNLIEKKIKNTRCNTSVFNDERQNRTLKALKICENIPK